LIAPRVNRRLEKGDAEPMNFPSLAIPFHEDNSRILPARLDQSPTVQAMAMTDLHMMVRLTVRERTEAEFRNLLQDAVGF